MLPRRPPWKPLLSALRRRPPICLQCLRHLSVPRNQQPSRHQSTSGAAHPISLPGSTPSKPAWKPQSYFLSNLSLRGNASQNTPPVRRRRKPAPEAEERPPDAPSLYTTQAAASRSALKRQCLAYLALSKPRLTVLVVLTTMASYSLFPVDPLLASPLAPSLSALTLIYLTSGTFLCSASANALNMYAEPTHDAKMSRTRNRPLVRGLLSGKQAVGFAAISGTVGVGALYLGVNPTVAALGALNIVLYAGVYTPMKRISVANTWVGAIVGGIPPLMGWAAASGAVATSGDFMELLGHPGGWLLAALLFAWQFPHFNALSYAIKDEYKRAGYQMAVWKYPGMNARVALRYSLLFYPICVGMWYYGVTDAGFMVTSSFVNAWLVTEAFKFWYKGGEQGRARGLFWASVWHLPLLLGLAMVHKVGLWAGIWERIVGSEESVEWADEDGSALAVPQK